MAPQRIVGRLIDRVLKPRPLGRLKHRIALAGAASAALMALVLAAVRLAAGPLEPDTEEPVITMVTGEDVTGGGLYRLFVEEWNATRADGAVRVELVEIPGGADMVRAEVLRWMQAEGFSYDILNIDNQWTAEFAQRGWIEELPASMPTEGVLQPSLDAVAYDGTRWAMPFVADVGLLYYRADLLEEDRLGGGWAHTFEVLRETARAEGLDYAYSGQFAPYEGLTVNALELTYGMRGSEGDGAAPVEFAAGSGRAAVDLVARSLADGTLHPGALADGATEYRSFRHFVDGEVVAMRNWPGWYDRLVDDPAVEPVNGEASPDGPAEAGGPSGGAAAGAAAGADPIEFGVAALPSESVLGGQSLTVNSGSDHQKSAWDFIAYLTAPEQQRRLLYCGGYAPVLEAAYTGPVEGDCPRELAPEHAPAQPTVESRRGAEFSRLLLEEVGNAHQRPTTPYYARYSHVLHAGLNRLLGESEGELSDGDLAWLDTRLKEALEGR